MHTWQLTILIFVLCYSVVGFILGFRNTYFKKNPFGLAPYLNPLGAFVWADAVVFSAFFALSSLLALFLGNFILFCLVVSVFWVIRSIGEQIYWFLEQFAEKHKNKPRDLKMSKYFPGESIYIYYQIFWQCISVVAIIASVYFFKIFLSKPF